MICLGYEKNLDYELKKESRVEKLIKGKGYELVGETPPFRLYEKHGKRIVYHTPSDKIWGKFDLEHPLGNVKDLSYNVEKPKHL